MTHNTEHVAVGTPVTLEYVYEDGTGTVVLATGPVVRYGRDQWNRYVVVRDAVGGWEAEGYLNNRHRLTAQ